MLRIVRTFRTPEGKEYTRTELVRKPLVIETYIKVRETKDEQFIRQFATLDDQAKEEMKKEKRRIQEQLRRIKRNEERERAGLSTKLSKKAQLRAEAKAKKDLKLVCGACGGKGHMRTNKACPKFVPEFEDEAVGNVAMTEQDEEHLEKKLFEEIEGVVNVDGTKVKVSKSVLDQADKIRRESMKLKFPMKAMKAAASAKRRRAGTVEHCDYLTNKNYRPAKRRRTDPLISFASYLESIHSDLRVMDEALQFLQPVSAKKLPSYFDVIKNPMDLQTVRENIQKKKYHSREEFLADINQIVENSSIFNGAEDIHTLNATKLLNVVIQKFGEKEDILMRLEKAINPLLDDNDQVALTYILSNILNDKVKSMQESWPFMKPVNKKQNKTYYEIIKTPMDLETISQRVTKSQYHSRGEFVSDVELIYTNSLQYNGEASEFTVKAKKILEVVNTTLETYVDHLDELEKRISETQRIALEQADMDSLGTSLGGENPEDVPVKKKRGRPRKKKGLKITSAEYIDVGFEGESATSPNDDSNAGGNLEDDLQYSSEEEEEEEDWEEVDDDNAGPSAGFTVTVDDQQQPVMTMEYNYDNQEVVKTEEVEIDENYDPSEFFAGIGKVQQDQPPPEPQSGTTSGFLEAAVADIGMEVGEVKEEQPITVESTFTIPQLEHDSIKNESVDIGDDLDISDLDDDDDDTPAQSETPQQPKSDPQPEQQQQQQQQQSSTQEAPDDDAFWF